jgi:hypothetical protein
MGGETVNVYTGFSCTLHPTGVGQGLRRGHLTASHFQVTPYEVSYGIVRVVASQVCLFSSFLFALGYVVTHPESVPFTCEEGYRP